MSIKALIDAVQSSRERVVFSPLGTIANGYTSSILRPISGVDLPVVGSRPGMWTLRSGQVYLYLHTYKHVCLLTHLYTHTFFSSLY